jgi:two-component system, NtrC family, response regulator AlgB
VASGPLVELEHLPSPIADTSRSAAAGSAALTLDQLEADHIRRVLAAAPTIEEAAATLGIDPSTLYRKRKRYGI